MKKRKRTIYRKSYIRLRRLASLLNLSISRYFSFGSKAIGLDQVNKTVLISPGNGEQETSLIEMEKISRISLKKSYGSIKAGELSKNAMGQFLKYIGLQFEYINSKTPTVLSLFEKEKDENKDLVRLDLSSKKLHLVLSKMIDNTNRSGMPVG